MEIMKLRVFAGLGLAIAALFLAGCETDSSPKYSFDPLAPNAAPSNTGGVAASNTSDASSNGAIASNVPMVPPASGDVTGMTIHVGDLLSFTFSDVPAPPTPMEDTVKDDGSVTLMYNEKFQASGKTIGELQNEIRNRYVPQYFKYLTVTVKPQERFYFVDGEVHQPNRFVYSGRMTVLQAISTAGGFTDFSRKGKVKVIRANGESFYVDCKKALTHSELNKEIYPNDTVHVEKKLF